MQNSGFPQIAWSKLTPWILSHSPGLSGKRMSHCRGERLTPRLPVSTAWLDEILRQHSEKITSVTSCVICGTSSIGLCARYWPTPLGCFSISRGGISHSMGTAFSPCECHDKVAHQVVGICVYTLCHRATIGDFWHEVPTPKSK